MPRTAAHLARLFLLVGAATPWLATPARAQRPAPRDPGLIRVCADPDNMPSSNQKGEGFENKIAELIAGELKAKLSYVWYPTRRGYFRILNGMLLRHGPGGADGSGHDRGDQALLPLGLRVRRPPGQRARRPQFARRPPSQEAQDRRQHLHLRRREFTARHGAEPLRRGGQPARLFHVLQRPGPTRGHHQGRGQQGRGHRHRLGAAGRLFHQEAGGCRSS